MWAHIAIAVGGVLGCGARFAIELADSHEKTRRPEEEETETAERVYILHAGYQRSADANAEPIPRVDSYR
jgi:hypothetical protein